MCMDIVLQPSLQLGLQFSLLKKIPNPSNPSNPCLKRAFKPLFCCRSSLTLFSSTKMASPPGGAAILGKLTGSLVGASRTSSAWVKFTPNSSANCCKLLSWICAESVSAHLKGKGLLFMSERSSETTVPLTLHSSFVGQSMSWIFLFDLM